MYFAVPEWGWKNPIPKSGGGDLLVGPNLMGGFIMDSCVRSKTYWGNLVILWKTKELASRNYNKIEGSVFLCVRMKIQEFEREMKGKKFYSRLQAKIGQSFLS